MSDGTSSPSEWQPLVANSIEDLLRMNMRPLAALQHRDIPAIVVRGVLPASESTAVAGRLLKQHWTNMKAGYFKIGVELHDYLINLKFSTRDRLTSQKRTSASSSSSVQQQHLYPNELAASEGYANATARMSSHYSTAGLWPAVAALHRVLEELHVAGRNSSSAKEAAFRTLAPGMFRRQNPGNVFTPHADTLHSADWPAKCFPSPRRPPPDSAGAPGPAAGRAFHDMVRFRDQFSALVMLQAPGDGSRDQGEPQVQIFDAHYRELAAGACSLARGNPYSVGIAFSDWHAPHARANRTRAHVRALNLSLQPGDVYVFNSNLVHEVLRVPPGPPRLTLGSFVGYSASEMRVW